MRVCVRGQCGGRAELDWTGTYSGTYCCRELEVIATSQFKLLLVLLLLVLSPHYRLRSTTTASISTCGDGGSLQHHNGQPGTDAWGPMKSDSGVDWGVSLCFFQCNTQVLCFTVVLGLVCPRGLGPLPPAGRNLPSR